MPLNPTFSLGWKKVISFHNIDGLSDKRINEALSLWPIPLCLYPQLCTVRDHAHSYVDTRHSRFHVLPPSKALLSKGRTALKKTGPGKRTIRVLETSVELSLKGISGSQLPRACSRGIAASV